MLIPFCIASNHSLKMNSNDKHQEERIGNLKDYLQDFEPYVYSEEYSKEKSVKYNKTRDPKVKIESYLTIIYILLVFKYFF